MEKKLKKAFEFIKQEEETMKKLWFDLCRIESQSLDREGINKAVEFLEKNLKNFGMKTQVFDYGSGGNSITAYFDNGSKELETIIIGHLDTVHKKGSFGEEVIRIDEANDMIYGPGVLDCKGGVVIGAFVARVLNHIGYNKIVKLAYSGDEEVGHQTTNGKGKEFFLEEAKGFKTAIDCETGFTDGRIVVGRKGAARFQIIIQGKGAHAGNEPENGVSAIKEAAYKILRIEEENDYNSTHYNVGIINGGTNVGSIPENCTLTIDVRYRKASDIKEIRDFLERVTKKTYVKGTKSELKEILIFDSMDETEKNKRLFEIVKENSERLNLGIPYPCFLGGGSDAAYTVALGIPTICAMGVQGYENHTIRERAVISSFIERTKLIVASILSLPEVI